MKFQDILKAAVQNLRRHKNRTILTALGVMIGCTSILVMISIGNGLTASQEKMIRDMGSVELITVYPRYESDGQQNGLNDKTFEEMVSIDHVVGGSPFLEPQDLDMELTTQNGTYKLPWVNMVGIRTDMMKSLGFKVIEGEETLQNTGASIPVFCGQYTAYDFMDTRRPEGQNMIDRYGSNNVMSGYGGGVVIDGGGEEEFDQSQIPDPYFDILDAPLTLSMKAFEGSGTSSVPSIYRLKAVGVLEEDYNLAYQTSSGIIMDLDMMKNIIRESRRNAGLPAMEFNYSQVVLRADSIDAVEDIEKQIEEMGFSASSMQDVLQSLQEQSRTTQLILGGLGAIALIVAAIGITNTMIMSISERTREIGIMKALGCSTKDIQMIFLSEAGLIGFLGGVVGVLFSYLISMVINWFVWPKDGGLWGFLSWLWTPGNGISIITPGLVVFGLAFSILIGLFAGWFPARRTTKISALEAMRYF